MARISIKNRVAAPERLDHLKDFLVEGFKEAHGIWNREDLRVNTWENILVRSALAGFHILKNRPRLFNGLALTYLRNVRPWYDCEAIIDTFGRNMDMMRSGKSEYEIDGAIFTAGVVESAYKTRLRQLLGRRFQP